MIAPLAMGPGGLALVAANASAGHSMLESGETTLFDGGISLVLTPAAGRSGWFGALSLGLGSRDAKIAPAGFQFTSVLGYRQSVADSFSLRWGAGAGLSLREMDVGVHPFLDLAWRPGASIEFSGRLPANFAVNWIPRPGWDLGARWRLEAGDFASSGSNELLQIQRLALESFVSRELTSRLRIEGDIGWLVRNRFLLLDSRSMKWNLWGYEIAGSQRAQVVENRTGGLIRLSLSLRLNGT